MFQQIHQLLIFVGRYPALICGNTVVLKSSEDAPQIALEVIKLSKEAGIPNGVINTINGLAQAGKTLVNDKRISLISFTGSSKVGKVIAQSAGARLARISLELGGKNPFIVCSDADIDNAVSWASLSAFSNAGQRCASGSRLIVFEEVYDVFLEKLTNKANSLKLGIDESCDLGPVINKKQFENILKNIEIAVKEGGKIICGGKKSVNKGLSNGYYIEPTIITNLDANVVLQK